jgi:plasmid stability protein
MRSSLVISVESKYGEHVGCQVRHAFPNSQLRCRLGGALRHRVRTKFGGSKREEAYQVFLPFTTRQPTALRGVQSGVCLPAEQLLALLAAGGDRNVAQLMVRNVDEAVVRELKKRAARRNHSAEQEHREILEQALLRPRRRSLAEVLAAMPDAGEDADFERRQIDRRV